ncbi:NAD(P)/FAD-dependent oxidoreductase [Echinicola strongylocentroti]|uniref:NAD(P)/FAD-dependent oxidoreductase n=1 Tax=Echinicola strongylocentroti TaxID=1795355 RepID=A0A2Z4IDH3_9BACT|nr:NAD(P)/FAD-dependent oxidoreductase [Echinicola strongylocentroti]AWW29072.1 NAD(P)/FAD-dependent oxidoreductase [Echinicola strongylocentroti]
MNDNTYDAIIIGGSYAGLSAALALGRSLRSTLILDSGTPCNKQTPYSHNFLTQDGKSPSEIAAVALEQVLQYPTVQINHEEVIDAQKVGDVFELQTSSGRVYIAKKLLFATGIKDQIPDMEGFAACWGISVIHCPYCHGYEVKKLPTAIMANGDKAFHMGKLLQNWTDQITLLTNGESQLTTEQHGQLEKDGLRILTQKVASLQHQNGQLESIQLTDGSALDFPVMYAALPFSQSSELISKLGCEINEHGHVTVSGKQETTIPGIYAAGDNTNPLRAVSMAVSSGTTAGAMINFDLLGF